MEPKEEIREERRPVKKVKRTPEQIEAEKKELNNFRENVNKMHDYNDIAKAIGVDANTLVTYIPDIVSSKNKMKSMSDVIYILLESSNMFNPVDQIMEYEIDEYGEYKLDNQGKPIQKGLRNKYNKLDRAKVMIALGRALLLDKLSKLRPEQKTAEGYIQYLKDKAKIQRENRKKIKEKYLGPRDKDKFKSE